MPPPALLNVSALCRNRASRNITLWGYRLYIKGSINGAAVNGVNGHNEFKSADELRVQFADALAKPRVITYAAAALPHRVRRCC